MTSDVDSPVSIAPIIKKKRRKPRYRKRTNYYRELYAMLTKSKYKVHIQQLADGQVFVYNSDFLMASFSYFGGNYIRELKLNTRTYLDKEIGSPLLLDDSYLDGGNKLKLLLDIILPDAGLCVGWFQFAKELAFVESILMDSDTVIEIENKTKRSFDVVLINDAKYASCSFHYVPTSYTISDVFIRYSRRHKDIRMDISIKIPEFKRELIHGVIMDKY